jgi:5'-3' exonuclease
MGIKHFFFWFSKNHNDCITTVHTDTCLADRNILIDTLALDLNGIFHPAAQKIFKYGSYAPKIQRLLSITGEHKEESIKKLQVQCFKEICSRIDELVKRVNPRKRLLLCVDGVAGMSKLQQQRQRRFKSAQEQQNSIDSKFDSCSITPGTTFMHYLNKYIDWHIRQKINNGEWAHLDVVFSSEKVPGEGEHLCVQLFKTYCDPSESMMIYGLDADLIMLCLASNLPNIYIYRDNMYNDKERFVIDIGLFAKNLKRDLGTNSAVTDFIFMCFMVGNDFLPQIPGLEIMNNGIEIMIKTYIQYCKPFGLINTYEHTIRMNAFLMFCEKLSEHELSSLKIKYINRKKYHEDKLLETYFYVHDFLEIIDEYKNIEQTVECNFPLFKQAYYDEKLGIQNADDVTTMCHEYIKGLHWVIQYYCVGIPSWTWFFPYNYGPFMDDLAKSRKYNFTPFAPTQPLTSFEQLLAVLPPQSSNLLPVSLRTIMTSEVSPMKKYYPEVFNVDLSGKRAEWEGIAILPIMDFALLKSTYASIGSIKDKKDFMLNKREKTKRYFLTDAPPVIWKGCFGDIKDCKISVTDV